MNIIYKFTGLCIIITNFLICLGLSLENVLFVHIGLVIAGLPLISAVIYYVKYKKLPSTISENKKEPQVLKTGVFHLTPEHDETVADKIGLIKSKK